MSDTNVTKLFSWLDQTTEEVEALTEEPYLESLALSLEALFYGEFKQSDLKKLRYREIDLEDYGTKDVRKAIQLALIKGMKENIQHQHSMTPEGIAMFIGYLAQKLTESHEGTLRIFDPAHGTGNLLYVVMEQLDKPLEAFASEVDPTLLKLALHSANLQKKEVELFHQDSLSPLLLDPVDLVVTDLPVGYYPDDIQARDFELRAKEGHSYAHHLFIEQSLKYTKSDGILIFIIPNFLFTSDQSSQLKSYLQANAKIVGVIQLPESAFKTKEQIKSILIIRKKGKSKKEYQQPLLVNLPKMTNEVAMQDILLQINGWFKEHYKEK